MTPEQQAAYVNAQAAMAMLELAALNAKWACETHIVGEVASRRYQDYLDLERRYAFVLGHNAVISQFHGYR